MIIPNGDFCAGYGIYRSSHLWLKCNPKVTERPTKVGVAEADPANPSVLTPCMYYYDVIEHASFCPLPKPPVDATPLVSTSISVG
jgi:hypothetical protein